MSKLSDYSKFDHLDDDSSDDEAERQQRQSQPVVAQQQPVAQPRPRPQPQSSQTQTTPTAAIQRKHETKSGRYVFEYNGKPIYEWEQKLEEVTIYVKPPPFVQKGTQIICNIQPQHLQLRLVDASSWYLNESTFGLVDVDESTWSLEDDDDDNNDNNNGGGKIVCIYLIKAQKGVLWDTALKGIIHQNNNQQVGGGDGSSSSNNNVIKLDPACQEQVRKDLLLERFQEENPGFDFSDADFNGSVPDARTFMGGVKYS